MCVGAIPDKTSYSPIQNKESSDSLTSDTVKSGRFFTQAKIKRIALYIFAALAAAAGCAAVALGTAMIVTGPHALTSIPLFVGAAGCFGLSGWLFYRARQIRDYENPAELQVMREQASQLSFPQLIKLHGLDRLQQYKIVTQKELQEKFQKEFSTAPLSKIVSQYPLKTIEQYGLCGDGFLQEKFHEEFQNQHFSKIEKHFSLDTITKYNLAQEGFLQKKFTEQITGKLTELQKRTNLSHSQMQEECFRSILATHSLETIRTYNLLSSSLIGILKEFSDTKHAFIQKKDRLDQKYNTRMGKKLSHLESNRNAIIAKAHSQAEELARNAADQAREQADRINHRARAQYRYACDQRERNIAHYLRHNPRQRLNAALLFPQIPPPPIMYPAPTKSAEAYYSEIEPREAIAALKENKHLIQQNNIGAAAQAAYNKELQEAEDAYKIKVGQQYKLFKHALAR